MYIEIISKDDDRLGLPYEEYIKIHWQRLYRIPKDCNPTLMNNGNKDSIHNDGKVFYLCASNNPQPISLESRDTIKRKINVSKGKYLFLPIMSILYPEDKRGKEYPEKIIKKDQKSIIRKTLTVEFNGSTNYAFKMDYEKLQNFEFDPKKMGSFDIYYPCDPDKCFYPIKTTSPYHTKARVGGHYLIVAPSKGEHKIHWRGELYSSVYDSADDVYKENITYIVNVN